MADFREKALLVSCRGQSLPAILHQSAETATTGVVIVVGGPQYRVGSHRQFVKIARQLASLGLPVLRFDYRGMGDADGPETRFDETSPDIEAAIDRFVESLPQLKEIVLLGLCDAASACMIYAHSDPRVRRLVLINPWARGGDRPDIAARRQLRYYYLPRLFSAGFWAKLVRLRVSIRTAARDLRDLLSRPSRSSEPPSHVEHSYVMRMLDGVTQFSGEVMLLLSERDLTAREFADLAETSVDWQTQFASTRWKTVTVADADHTWSAADVLPGAVQRVVDWLGDSPQAD